MRLSRSRSVWILISISTAVLAGLSLLIILRRDGARSGLTEHPIKQSEIAATYESSPAKVSIQSHETQPVDCNQLEAYERQDCNFWQNTNLPQNADEAAHVINAHYAKEGMIFSYWPAKDLPKSEWPKFNISRGPCGEMAHVKSLLVNPPDPRLISYRAVEVDSSGMVVRLWAVPEGWGWSARGEENLMKYLPQYGASRRDDLLLAVSTDGHYRVGPRGDMQEALVVKHVSGEPFQCPPYGGFGDSEFAACSIIREAGHATRYLIWEGPCT